MNLKLLGTVTPVYCIGDSHCIGYNEIIAGSDWSRDIFLCKSLFRKGYNYFGEDGQVSKEFMSALSAQRLVDSAGCAQYLSEAPNLAFIAGRPVIAPAIVMFGGGSEHASMRIEIGRNQDFVLPGADQYAFDPAKELVPLQFLRAALEKKLRPFFAIVSGLQKSRFDRLIVHGIPPCPRDNNIFNEATAIDASIYNKLALLTNRALAAFCEQHGIPYVDVWEETATPEGYLRQEYSLDGVHLTRGGLLISLEKIAGTFIDHTAGIHNSLRYQEAVRAARLTPHASTTDLNKLYAAHGFVMQSLSLMPMADTVAALDFSYRQNRHARMDWVGAPRVGRSGIAAAEATPKLLKEAHALLSAEEAQSLLHAGSPCALSISAFRPVRLDPGEGAIPAAGNLGGPEGARRGIVAHTPGLVIEITTLNGGDVARHTLTPGTFVVYDVARVRLDYRQSDMPLTLFECALTPRLSRHPFRLFWAGLNDWPADPFQYSIAGMWSYPPITGTSVHEYPGEMPKWL